jgi:hypothetical protein
MKPPWQQHQQQMRRQQEQMRRQQEQMRRQQEQMRRQQEQRRQQMGADWLEKQRRQQMGADWLEKQRWRGLEEEPGLRPSHAVDEGPSCIGRLARIFFSLLVIAVVLFLAFACLSSAVGSSF